MKDIAYQNGGGSGHYYHEAIYDYRKNILMEHMIYQFSLIQILIHINTSIVEIRIGGMNFIKLHFLRFITQV
jgi:hypothetical protein